MNGILAGVALIALASFAVGALFSLLVCKIEFRLRGEGEDENMCLNVDCPREGGEP